MGPSDALHALVTVLLVPLFVGCAEVSYRERSTIAHTRYATLQDYGAEPVTAERIDDLLEEVADLLNVTLDPKVPKVRVMVMPASRIAELYRKIQTVAPHGADARAFYLPRASVIAVPYYTRTILGHELAHYLTDHYLKSTPRQSWERIALRVEDELPDRPRLVARRPLTPDAVTRQAILARPAGD
jgi:hypothetical protein